MTDDYRYDFLRRKRYVVHEEHEHFIRPETLAEMREYETIEFYSCERIRELSQKGLIHWELRRRIDELRRLRQEHPEGSNPECICMDYVFPDKPSSRLFQLSMMLEPSGKRLQNTGM